MRKRLFPLVAILAASACLGGATEPDAGADITGFYTLRILGPCTMSIRGCYINGDATVDHYIMEASLLLSSDLSYEVHGVGQERTSLGTTDTTFGGSGTYARNGGTLTMTDTATHVVTTGQLNLNQITIKSGGITFIYKK